MFGVFFAILLIVALFIMACVIPLLTNDRSSVVRVVMLPLPVTLTLLCSALRINKLFKLNTTGVITPDPLLYWPFSSIAALDPF